MSKYSVVRIPRRLHELELVTQPRAMLQICRAEDGHVFEVRETCLGCRTCVLIPVQVNTTIWDIERYALTLWRPLKLYSCVCYQDG